MCNQFRRLPVTSTSADKSRDIQSLGIEKLRQEYAASGLSIKPQTRLSKIETIKEMMRAMGEDPEKILTREAQTQPATTHLQPQDYDNHHLEILYQHLMVECPYDNDRVDESRKQR